MTDEKPCCGDIEENAQKVDNLGWLDDNGICHFPEEVAAVPAGYKCPGLPVTFFSQASPEQIQVAIDMGWIKFIDGEGNSMTFKDYVAKYPDYPDPVFILTLQGRFPPRCDRFIQLGGSRKSSNKTFNVG